MSEFHTDYRNQLERAAAALFAPGNLDRARAGTGRPARLPARGLAISAAILGLAGLLVLAGLAFTGGGGQPAYAVVVRPDGSVALTLSEIVGVGPANERLIQLGVPVRLARAEEGCTARGTVASLSGAGGAERSPAPATPAPGSSRRREQVLVALRLRSERALARLLQIVDVEKEEESPALLG